MIVKSIKEIGIITPIIVRSIGRDNEKYEILSGHNRVNAAKVAELSELMSPESFEHIISGGGLAVILPFFGLITAH